MGSYQRQCNTILFLIISKYLDASQSGRIFRSILMEIKYKQKTSVYCVWGIASKLRARYPNLPSAVLIY